MGISYPPGKSLVEHLDSKDNDDCAEYQAQQFGLSLDENLRDPTASRRDTPA